MRSSDDGDGVVNDGDQERSNSTWSAGNSTRREGENEQGQTVSSPAVGQKLKE